MSSLEPKEVLESLLQIIDEAEKLDYELYHKFMQKVVSITRQLNKKNILMSLSERKTITIIQRILNHQNIQIAMLERGVDAACTEELIIIRENLINVTMTGLPDKL